MLKIDQGSRAEVLARRRLVRRLGQPSRRNRSSVGQGRAMEVTDGQELNSG